MYVRNTNIRLTIWNTYFLTYTHSVCDACVYYAHRLPAGDIRIFLGYPLDFRVEPCF